VCEREKEGEVRELLKVGGGTRIARWRLCKRASAEELLK